MLPNTDVSSSRDAARELKRKRGKSRVQKLIILGDHVHEDSKEVPLQCTELRISRPTSSDNDKDGLSPLSVSRRTSFIHGGAMTEVLVRGRSVSPDRSTSKDLGDLKNKLKSLALSKSMPNLQGRSSYNRCVAFTILSDVTEIDQVSGTLIASAQAAELDLLLHDLTPAHSIPTNSPPAPVFQCHGDTMAVIPPR
jgi:hypothetical protein